MYICVGTLQNIHRFWPFWQIQSSFSYFKKMKGFICSFGLDCRHISLCIFNCQICILPLFLVLFFKNLNLHLCRKITQNIKDSSYFDKFVLLLRFTDTLVCKPGIWVLLDSTNCCIFIFKKCIFLLSWEIFVEISKQFFIQIFTNSQTSLYIILCEKYFTSILTDGLWFELI